MFCNKCGSEIKEDNKFCTNCGNKVIKDENDCYILFERMKQFYGCLVPINIYLDGNRVGSVKSNKSIKIDTTYGNHKLSFNLWSGNVMYDINIAKGENVKVTFKLSMGLVTSEPEIISIEKIRD